MRTVFNCLTKANHYTTGFQVFHTMMSLDTYATLSPNLQNDLFLDFPFKKPRADTHPKYLRGCHVRFFRCVQYQKVTDRLLYISRNNW